MATDRMTMFAIRIVAIIFNENLTQLEKSILEIASPPITTPLVGVIRFIRPHAAVKIIIMTSGLKFRLCASGAKIPMDPVARPEVEGIRNDRPR